MPGQEVGPYPRSNVVSSKAFKQMNNVMRFLFSKDTPSGRVGNEWEGEETEVPGECGICGTDDFCPPSCPV